MTVARAATVGAIVVGVTFFGAVQPHVSSLCHIMLATALIVLVIPAIRVRLRP
ncbi:unnamed protein product, partial [marine sediment metagenome]